MRAFDYQVGDLVEIIRDGFYHRPYKKGEIWKVSSIMINPENVRIILPHETDDSNYAIVTVQESRQISLEAVPYGTLYDYSKQ